MIQDISALLRARNTLLWVVTREEVRVERALVEAAAAAKFTTRFWDCADGLSAMTKDGKRQELNRSGNPDDALETIKSDRTRAVYVMRDMHKWLDPTVLRKLRNLSRDLQSAEPTEGRAVIIITPSTEIPPELTGHATVIDYPLPDRAEMATILDDVLSVVDPTIRANALPEGTRDAAIDAAVGLTAAIFPPACSDLVMRYLRGC